MDDQSSASTAKAAGRGRIYDSILETIGDTPLIRLSKLAKEEELRAYFRTKVNDQQAMRETPTI